MFLLEVIRNAGSDLHLLGETWNADLVKIGVERIVETADVNGRYDPGAYVAVTDGKGNLKCAYGIASENTMYGEGGGNQYYISRKEIIL